MVRWAEPHPGSGGESAGGIVMLARVVGQHWFPLVRDVLSLGYKTEDMFTTLSVAEMVAIVQAAPPDSSIRFFMDGGWTRTDHLLANMQEDSAGLANLSSPYERPGVDDEDLGDPRKMFGGKSSEMTWEEAAERDKERYAAAARMAEQGIKPKNTRVRTL